MSSQHDRLEVLLPIVKTVVLCLRSCPLVFGAWNGVPDPLQEPRDVRHVDQGATLLFLFFPLGGKSFPEVFESGRPHICVGLGHPSRRSPKDVVILW